MNSNLIKNFYGTQEKLIYTCSFTEKELKLSPSGYTYLFTDEVCTDAGTVRIQLAFTRSLINDLTSLMKDLPAFSFEKRSERLILTLISDDVKEFKKNNDIYICRHRKHLDNISYLYEFRTTKA